MHEIQTESVSGLRNNYDKVLKQLSNGPVLLLQRSKLAAVLVAPDTWNGLMRELEELRDQLDIQQAELELGHAQSELVDIAELEAMVDHGLPT